MELDQDLYSIQEVRNKLLTAEKAQTLIEQLTQSEVDQIVVHMCKRAVEHAESLAEMAVKETGFGKVKDKKTKNLFASGQVYEAIKEMKTVGIIHEDHEKQVWDVAEPVGIIAGIIPSTNPTSTIIFKSLISVKARNAIVFSPHPSALTCSLEAAKIMAEAVVEAGGPEGLIQCLEHPSLEASKELMSHRRTDLILATGGPGMVKAAYSAGKPAYGVGPGNVPVYVHKSADVKKAARQIIESKSFDYGTICASEQAVVVDASIKENLISELKRNGAYFLTENEKSRMGSLILKGNGLNSDIVGKSPQALGKMIEMEVNESVKVLVGEETKIGKAVPFAVEKLSPILALYTVEDWTQGCEFCMHLLEVGGLGHTLGIHANDQKVIREFALKKPASRIIVNSGTTFGGIGATTGIFPSMTLGCGSYGNNITSDNIGPQHLMNIKRVAFGIREMAEEQEKTEVEEISEEVIAEIIKKVLNQMK